MCGSSRAVDGGCGTLTWALRLPSRFAGPIWLLDETDPADLPALYVCCGTEDDLIEDNRSSLRQPPIVAFG